MIKKKSYGAIVYRKYGSEVEFIAIKSKANGYWGFPKGRMEKGENEKETARREVLEETGLNITFLDGFKTKIEYTLPEGRIKEVIFFIGKISNRILNLQKDEIHEFKWLNYNNMLNLLTYENSKKALMEVNSFLNNLNLDK